MGQVIEGTWEEVASRASEFAGHRLMVIVDPTDEQVSHQLPDAPFAIHDESQLAAILSEAINSPAREVTDETWERRYRELNDRLAMRIPRRQ